MAKFEMPMYPDERMGVDITQPGTVIPQMPMDMPASNTPPVPNKKKGVKPKAKTKAAVKPKPPQKS